MEQTLKTKYDIAVPNPITFQKDIRTLRKPSDKNSILNTLIGIEVELENVKVKKNIENPLRWRTVPDNSLKIDGMEFTVPILYGNIEVALENLINNLEHYKTSARCSVHIHVNVADLTESQLTTLILVYTIFERFLFEESGRRFNSNYCVPLQHQVIPPIENEISIVKAAKFPKYSAIHLFAETDAGKLLGTLEFRHLKGTLDVNYIKNWVYYLVSMHYYAQNTHLNQFKKNLYDMRVSSAYINLFETVFNMPLPINLFPHKKLILDMEKGVSFAKLLLDY